MVVRYNYQVELNVSISFHSGHIRLPLTMVTATHGKKAGGFRSLFKRKKGVEAEGAVAQKSVEKPKASVANDAQSKTAPTSLPAPPPKPAPVVESRPPVPEVSIVNKPIKQEKSSWISRTNYFKQMSNWAFDVVDLDGSGFVDEKVSFALHCPRQRMPSHVLIVLQELYSGLLLIHLKLGSYAGPAACRPVARERVHDLFIKRDCDNSGSLDREEFGEVIAVLCGNVFTRVAAQWSLTLIIVPMVAKLLLDGIVSFVSFCSDFLTSLEGYDMIEAAAVFQYNQICGWMYDASPDFLMSAGSTVVSRTQGFVDMIPDSVWSTIPVTLVSCVLGCLAVPYIIFKIDDFFQALGERKNTKSRAAGK